jgi:hypothetical protein
VLAPWIAEHLVEHRGLWSRLAEVVGPAVTALVMKTRAALEKEAQARHYDLVDVEQAVEGMLRQAAPLLVRYVVDQVGRGRVRNEHVCPTCGGPMRFVQDAPRRWGFLFGEVRVKRARYHCDRCHKGRAPLEQVWGLQSGPCTMGKRRLTPKAQVQFITLCAAGAFAKARDHFRRLTGLAVSAMMAWRYTQRLGRWKREHAEEAVAAIPLAPGAEPGKGRRPLRWMIGADGIHVSVWKSKERRKRKGGGQQEKSGARGTTTREVKVGVIALLKRTGEVIAGSQWYMAMVAEAEEFRKRLRRVAEARGVRSIDEVVVASDAGNWLPALSTRHFTEATPVRDFFHAVEHLGVMGQALYGAGDQQAGLWQSEMAHRLKAEGAGALVKDWEKIVVTPSDPKGWQREIAYFRNNQGAMNYPEFRKQQIPMGSGSAEGGCKYAVGQRFNGPGSHWSEEGLLNLLPIRMAYVNGVPITA